MGSLGPVEQKEQDAQGSQFHQEKILVSIRVRPLNEKEIARNDVSDWHCLTNTTIIFKNSLSEKSVPPAYTFDRVFGCGCATKQVYQEGAKEVVLSALGGINSSIFAYGQTSSGKTYTMCGITEYAVADIYDYIQKHNEREYVLKFSAMEIYNESVRDLLSTDSTPLRLLDDPERGTVVEKLTEVTLTGRSHLKELISICESQRQIGETSLNEVSSRSHQILRLSIESSAREYTNAKTSSSLAAIVNFVDLAGSERASQTSSAGSRLKEGCHINRSLLTLGTVIRKLSKARNGHIPYRDSKLTRILQNSLGGNARTAIICTMSPARTHVEQSRNTLLFASCAKEVTINAQVNALMSEKTLVRQLQRELARMESELKSLASNSSTSNTADILKEKEELIEKMDKEIKDLTRQRDLAQSRIMDLIKSGQYQDSRTGDESDHLSDSQLEIASPYDYSPCKSSEVVNPHQSDFASCDLHLSDGGDGHKLNKQSLRLRKNSEGDFLLDGNSLHLVIDETYGPNSCHSRGRNDPRIDEDSEFQCKEVKCIDLEEPKIHREVKSDELLSQEEEDRNSGGKYQDPTYEALKQKINEMQKTIDCFGSPSTADQSPSFSETDMSDFGSTSISRSRSCRAILTSTSSSSWLDKAQKYGTPPNCFEKDFCRRQENSLAKLSDFGANSGKLYRKDSTISDSCTSMDENDNSTETLSEYGEAKSKSQRQFGEDLIKESDPRITRSQELVRSGGFDTVQSSQKSHPNWFSEFERQRREIIELWDACHVPLVHRTYFILLYKGDPSDSVYLEVELRRLAFLKQSLSQGNKITLEGQRLEQFASAKAIQKERDMLGRQILKRFPLKEREALYQKWDIALKTKRRSRQLSRLIWTDTKDMGHIKDSASLVAKLVGLSEETQAPKELFGLSFSLRPKRPSSWRSSMSIM